MPMNSGSESKNPGRAIGICKRSLTSADASIKQDMVFWPSKAKALCKAKRKLTGGWMVNISWITFTEPVQQAVRKRVAPGGDQMNGLALASSIVIDSCWPVQWSCPSCTPCIDFCTCWKKHLHDLFAVACGHGQDRNFGGKECMLPAFARGIVGVRPVADQNSNQRVLAQQDSIAEWCPACRIPFQDVPRLCWSGLSCNKTGHCQAIWAFCTPSCVKVRLQAFGRSEANKTLQVMVLEDSAENDICEYLRF